MKIASKGFQDIESNIKVQFKYCCDIELIADKDDNFLFTPQKRYKNAKGLPLLDGISPDTQFYKFKPDLPNASGVYLWTVDDDIIYIGRAKNLRERFVRGYGNISPRNCYKGGQSTNIKMNMVVVRKNCEEEKLIKIYIAETADYVCVEKYLLKRITTAYNTQNNKQAPAHYPPALTAIKQHSLNWIAQQKREV